MSKFLRVVRNASSALATLPMFRRCIGSVGRALALNAISEHSDRASFIQSIIDCWSSCSRLLKPGRVLRTAFQSAGPSNSVPAWRISASVGRRQSVACESFRGIAPPYRCIRRVVGAAALYGSGCSAAKPSRADSKFITMRVERTPFAELHHFGRLTACQGVRDGAGRPDRRQPAACRQRHARSGWSSSRGNAPASPLWSALSIPVCWPWWRKSAAGCEG